MKPRTIIDDLYYETTKEDYERMLSFIKNCPELPELNDVLSVTFTKEEWDEIFGEEVVK